MAKRSTSKMSEIEFLSNVGPLLASVKDEILGGMDGIEKKFPEITAKNYDNMMQHAVSVPYPWFIWMAAAANYAIERYELLKTTAEGNG